MAAPSPGVSARCGRRASRRTVWTARTYPRAAAGGVPAAPSCRSGLGHAVTPVSGLSSPPKGMFTSREAWGPFSRRPGGQRLVEEARSSRGVRAGQPRHDRGGPGAIRPPAGLEAIRRGATPFPIAASGAAWRQRPRRAAGAPRRPRVVPDPGYFLAISTLWSLMA